MKQAVSLCYTTGRIVGQDQLYISKETVIDYLYQSAIFQSSTSHGVAS